MRIKYDDMKIIEKRMRIEMPYNNMNTEIERI